MSHEMEVEDYLQQARAELASVQEELRRVRLSEEAKDRANELLLQENMRLKRDNNELRKQQQAWADEADEEIRLAALRRAELEALEL